MFSRIIVQSTTIATTYFADIDLDTGKAFYKILNGGKTLDATDCFYIIPLERLNPFKAALISLNMAHWADTYVSQSGGIVLDGFSWEIKLSADDSIVKVMSGLNACPDEFDDLISALETVLQKQFG